MEVDLKQLPRKLGPSCRRTLEAALGRCMTAGHYELTAEHWLLQLLDDPGSDLLPILRHFEISQAILQKTLQRGLDRLRTGNSGRPAFSPLLTLLMKDAWVNSSITMGHPLIRSGVLFSTFVGSAGRYSGEDFSSLFDNLRFDELKRDMDSICRTSREMTGDLEGASSEAFRALEDLVTGEKAAFRDLRFGDLVPRRAVRLRLLRVRRNPRAQCVLLGAALCEKIRVERLELPEVPLVVVLDDHAGKL